jgi:hypothetical protein
MPTIENLFGETVFVGKDTDEVRRICEKYPAAVDHPHLFFYFALKERYAWTHLLNEQQKHDLMDFCASLESLRRRRQEYREKNSV